ncbi:MAG: tetratricopeptide repeat protein [Polyangiaceae bacterium]
MNVADLSDVTARATKVARDAPTKTPLVVVGPTGAGRWSLGAEVVRLLGTQAIDVFLPPFEAQDAALHGLLQVAAVFGAAAMEEARKDAGPLRDRAAAVAARAVEAKRVLVIRVPESWCLVGSANTDGRAFREQRAKDLFAGWLSTPKFRAVLLLHDKSLGLVEWVEGIEGITCRRDSLPKPKVNREALQDESRWGSYAAAFGEVRRTEGVEGLSPIQLRLLVGLTHLGERPIDIVPTLWGGAGQLGPLLDRYREILALPENRTLLDSVRRALRTRFPLPTSAALQIAGFPKEHVPLITECLAYEHDGYLRIPDAVRARLRAPRSQDDATHTKLAEFHKGLDGAKKPPAKPAKIVHWLEKAHHLAHAGPGAAAQWDELEVSAEQLLDRAWSLSVEHHDWASAAKIYKRILDRNLLTRSSDKAYAVHYLGFNLERAGSPPTDVEKAYREAVKLETGNAWWNSRLVTFLIRDLRYAAADDEWRRSVERLDPMESRVSRDPWLARHVHRRVADEWLQHGQVDRARAVFRRIPNSVVVRDPQLLELRQRVEDATEAVVLGESVYPTHVPVRERWRAPRVLPEGQAKWMPGRVLAVDAQGVAFVVATPDSQRRVFKQRASVDEWTRWSGGSPPRVDMFF